jgi:hypothetical protein
MFAAAWGHCCSSTVGLDRLFPMVMRVSDDQQSAPSYPLCRVAAAQSCSVQAFLFLLVLALVLTEYKNKNKTESAFCRFTKSTSLFVIYKIGFYAFVIVIVGKPHLTV